MIVQLFAAVRPRPVDLARGDSRRCSSSSPGDRPSSSRFVPPPAQERQGARAALWGSRAWGCVALEASFAMRNRSALRPRCGGDSPDRYRPRPFTPTGQHLQQPAGVDTASHLRAPWRVRVGERFRAAGDAERVVSPSGRESDIDLPSVMRAGAGPGRVHGAGSSDGWVGLRRKLRDRLRTERSTDSARPNRGRIVTMVLGPAELVEAAESQRDGRPGRARTRCRSGSLPRRRARAARYPRSPRRRSRSRRAVDQWRRSRFLGGTKPAGRCPGSLWRRGGVGRLPGGSFCER